MRDLLLWRRLCSPVTDEAGIDLVASLREVAEWPLDRRVPWLGAIADRLKTADSAELRCVLLACLRDAVGRTALQRLVAALNDGEASVREQAVETLASVLSTHDPQRWVHVLFHPRPDVRRLALSGYRPYPEWWKFHLLADPDNADEARRILADFIAGADALPLLFDLHQRGILNAAAVRFHCRAVVWDDWLGFLGDHIPAGDRDLTPLLDDTMSPEWPERQKAALTPDRLDAMLGVHWRVDPDPNADDYRRIFWLRLLQGLEGESGMFRQWVVFSILTAAVVHDSWNDEAADLCALHYPSFLLCPWVTLEIRRRACDIFHTVGRSCQTRPVAVVRPILESDVCRADFGDGLDLRRIAAVLHVLDHGRYEYLLEWLGAKRVAEACLADIERGAVLFTVPDVSTRSRTLLVREVLSRAGVADRDRVAALLVKSLPGDALDFLDTFDAVTACRLFGELLPRIESERRRGFSDNKIRRLADVLARKIAAGQVERFLGLWMCYPGDTDHPLASAILTRLIHEHASRIVVPAIVAQPVDLLRRFLATMPGCAGFPYDEEIAVAERLLDHAEADVREWAVARLRDHEVVLARRRAAESDESQDAPASDGPSVLRLGLCARLRERTEAFPDVEACAALLASHDPWTEVVEQFGRFSSNESEFLTALAATMVERWRDEMRLPLLGQVWMHRWDKHKARLAKLLRLDAEEPLPSGERGVAAFLKQVTSPPLVVGFAVFDACLAVLEYWHWHDRAELDRQRDASLIAALAEALASPFGVHAVAIAEHWRDKDMDAARVERLRRGLIAVMPRAISGVIPLLHPWIDITGMHPTPSTVATLPSVTESAPDPFAEAFADLFPGETHNDYSAIRTLLDRGSEGQRILATLFDSRRDLPWSREALRQLPSSPVPELVEAMHRFLLDPTGQTYARFRMGWELSYVDELRSVVREPMLELFCDPGIAERLTTGDIEDFIPRFWSQEERPPVWLRMLRCATPSIHCEAARMLADPATPLVAEARKQLLEFLDLGTERSHEHRLLLADRLYGMGERESVLPLLLGVEPATDPKYPDLLCGADRDVILSVTRGVLIGGQGETAETQLLAQLNHGMFGFGQSRTNPLAPKRVDPFARQEAMGEIMAAARSKEARDRARRVVRSGLGRSHKLRRVAETFAWGVRLGRGLTGQVFTLEMLTTDDLGYTRLKEQKLWISPLPLLRGQANAKEVVRGLILHEYGHHLYHKGPGAEEVWEQAEREKLHRLLNLVSDEHLERNLRARDETFGNQFKSLGAYAFQHSAREVAIPTLLSTLRGGAFQVLAATTLGVARKEGHVLLHSGRTMLQMEKAGLSFARFFRALRMGLGNRHDDPKVAKALELFKGKFRQSDMDRLMEITRELRKIFGDETNLLNAFGQDVGLFGDSDELDEAAEGITNEELQAEIRRTLESDRRGDANRKTKGPPGGRGYNLGADEQFTTISEIIPKAYDPTAYASYAKQVERPAGRLRDVLRQLGLGMETQKGRLQGRSLDRARLRGMVIRGDPRVLVARQTRFVTDLFVGVLIDCSGSMSSYNNIEKAKLFASLIAEAADGLRGIDVRLFGFTDQAIYDCGSAARPAIHDLSPDCGNNDSAALWHAATVARASKRKAKLLVMISDGSPTGCTVASLKAVVRILTRQGMLCAQVAVQALDDVCFPDYVLLEEELLDASVKKFGEVITKLVRKVLRG